VELEAEVVVEMVMVMELEMEMETEMGEAVVELEVEVVELVVELEPEVETETGEAVEVEAATVGVASREVAAQRSLRLHRHRQPPLRQLWEVHHLSSIMVPAASSILTEGPP
jgi:hypothetical protein